MNDVLVRVEPGQIICPQENEKLPALAQEAKQYLGYLYGADVAERVDSAMSQRKQIRDVLIELDVRPFSPETVETYKRQKAKEAAGPLGCFVDRFNDALEIPFCILAVVAALCGIAWGLSWIPVLAGVWGTYCGWIAVSSLIVAVMCLISHGILSEVVAQPVWWRIPFKDYKAPIPEYVLQTGIDIKKRCSDAVLMVEGLVLEKRQLDPFLILKLPTIEEDVFQYLHLEVWEEPSFSAKRIEVADAVTLQH